MTARALAVIVVLAAAAATPPPAGAIPIELDVTSTKDGGVILARRPDLAVGDEVRFVRSSLRLPGRPGAVDVVAYLTLLEASDTRVRVALNGMVGEGAARGTLSWTARTFSLSPGETGGFVVEPLSDVRFAVRFAPEAGSIELRPVSLRATLRVRERTADGERLLDERRVRIEGPEPTELVFESGAGGRVALVVRLLAESRDDDGAVLAMDLEVPGRAPRTVREEHLELGFDDVVRIAGLSGDRGTLDIEIKPER